jgi:hypothetical protein
MPKHEVHIQKEIWVIYTSTNPKQAMGNCFHRFHDPTTQVEWDMDTILMVVDWLSKLAKMVPTKTIVTTFDLSKLFFDMWVTHQGMSQFIVSDKDIKFTMSF